MCNQSMNHLGRSRNGALFAFAAGVLAASVVLFARTPFAVAQPDSDGYSKNVADWKKSVGKLACLVQGPGNAWTVAYGGGTGFVINDDGAVVTNAHVLQGAVPVLKWGKPVKEQGQIVFRDVVCERMLFFQSPNEWVLLKGVVFSQKDLVVLTPINKYGSAVNQDGTKVKGIGKKLVIFDPADGQVSPGSDVTLIGYIGIGGTASADWYDYLDAVVNDTVRPTLPPGGDAIVRKGQVSSYNQNQSGRYEVFVDLQGGNGDSGSPLVDKNGRVIGVFSNVRSSGINRVDLGVDSIELIMFLKANSIPFTLIRIKDAFPTPWPPPPPPPDLPPEVVERDDRPDFVEGQVVESCVGDDCNHRTGIIAIVVAVLLLAGGIAYLLLRRKPGRYFLVGSFGTVEMSTFPFYVGAEDSLCDLVMNNLAKKALEFRPGDKGLEIRNPFSGWDVSTSSSLVPTGVWVAISDNERITISNSKKGMDSEVITVMRKRF